MKFQHEPGRVFALGEDGTLLAEITFPTEDGVAVINHTFVHESLRGQGVAGQLMREAVSAIRQAGLKLKPVCSYAVGWMEKHPEHGDLL